MKTKKLNISTGKKLISTGKKKISTGKKLISTDKKKISTGNKKISINKKKISTSKMLISTDKIAVNISDEQLLLNSMPLVSSPPVTLKEVKVKRTVFTTNYKALKVIQYINNCVNTGSKADLYKNPNITTAFYDEGTLASGNIQTSVNVCTLSPTKGNRGKIRTTISASKLWLNDYSDKVEDIANADVNRTTREEAATNIAQSFLSFQELINSSKGKPEPPQVSAKSTGNGCADAKVINGKEYNPAQTTFILVEVSAGAELKIVNGQLLIELKDKGQIIVKAAPKKGKFMHFTDLKPGVEYAIYAYAQNGTHQMSDLSDVVYVRG